jgi:DnaJ-class molecular chaperone
MALGASDQQADRCATCRGRGWLNVHTSPVYAPDALALPERPLPRETCWDCGGKGQVTAREPGLAPGWLGAAS